MTSKRIAAAAVAAEPDSSKTVTTKAAGEVKAKALKIPKATDAPIHPSTLSMVLEALRKNTDRKGATVPSIRTYILTTYPSVDSVRLRVLLRRALGKGMEQGLLIRPTNSTAKGATGRFKLAPARPKTLKKVSENSDPNGEQVPKAKKVVARKPKPAAAKKPKATGDAAKKTVKKVAASSKSETAVPKAKVDSDKASKIPAKKPKEKVATKGAAKEKTSEKKGEQAPKAASTSKENTDKDSAKPTAKRGKK
uniref:Oocyte-type linker histone B4 n=1 Tax=Cynops pyrrhogaster TaxID=8330 RepID=D0EUP4_CYNPY|nr:oocyte-type linker histone B4 [Cynops pyrrhogaster]